MKDNNIFRPKSLSEFIGNEDVKESLKVYLFSANTRKAAMDHILLYGPPGVGKTSLSYVISYELDRKIVALNAPTLEKIEDLINVLITLDNGDILFIDEIHRLNKEIEEVLYSVMEDFRISISFKSQENNKVLNLNIPPFTLIGATTLLGRLSQPLRERFGIQYKLNYYKAIELKKILELNAKKISLNFEEDALLEIAKRSRKTPRIANNLLKRVFDYSLFYTKEVVDLEFVKFVFRQMKIDEYGLTPEDYEILKIMYEKYYRSPVSLETIAINLNDTASNIMELNEPYLISLGLVERTKQGRKLTRVGEQFYENRIRGK